VGLQGRDPNMARIRQILRLALRHALLPRDLTERVPEPSVMNSPDSVAGFDAAGEKYLMPVYHFNARAIATLAGRNFHVLDIGSGSGRFLTYLGRHRPDLRITGIDLSEGMVETGRQTLAEFGLAARVRLACGDMRDLGPFLSEPVDLVSSVFALHHLETPTDLAACLGEISKFVANGASLWLFDHVRPRRQQTAVDFPEVLTPNAEGAFSQDSTNSLKASWSYGELSTALTAAGLVGVNSAKARFLPFYQIHWLAGPRKREGVEWVTGDDLSSTARSEARQFARLFRFAPGRP
jgi:SAM-dependent methyltransferase